MSQFEERETSEFQDTARTFQRIDEASVDAFNVWLAVIAGDFTRMNEFVDKTDVYFGIFRHICKTKEQEPIDTSRLALKKQIGIEMRRINHMRSYSPHLSPRISDKLIEDLREYKLDIDRMREDYKLASRTKQKVDQNKRIDNATKY